MERNIPHPSKMLFPVLKMPIMIISFCLDGSQQVEIMNSDLTPDESLGYQFSVWMPMVETWEGCFITASASTSTDGATLGAATLLFSTTSPLLRFPSDGVGWSLNSSGADGVPFTSGGTGICWCWEWCDPPFAGLDWQQPMVTGETDACPSGSGF